VRLQLAAVALVVLASGCVHTATTSGAQGDFELLVSDRPSSIDRFDSLQVEFSQARVHSQDGNYTRIDISNRTADLTELKGAKAESLVNATLESGNYSKIELYASDVGGIVNGSEVEVKIPSEKLQITKPFTVRPNSTTSFVFDIQVVLRGNQQNNQGYILKPVISQSGVAGEDVEVERRGGERELEDGNPDSQGTGGR
jgi:hypothetical protein